ncbi:hypothetical protein [Pseudarthrobacter sp. NamE2]|uniref:hypothetical protein n=1 Tax=Pseudarthrobacter sp. NamE2 TaxID=2576838 RepID=UPI0010FDCCB8|nr:hypothetical protein [Pseudarthrobacter sp. NamE2]
MEFTYLDTSGDGQADAVTAVGPDATYYLHDSGLNTHGTPNGVFDTFYVDYGNDGVWDVTAYDYNENQKIELITVDAQGGDGVQETTIADSNENTIADSNEAINPYTGKPGGVDVIIDSSNWAPDPFVDLGTGLGTWAWTLPDGWGIRMG